MEKAYAQALLQIIEQGMPQADAVRALHAKLKREGREALLPRIAKAFERLGAEMNIRDTITLTVADKAHEHEARKSTAAVSRFDLDKKDLAVRVDSSLIGGWRLEGQEQLIDASYKKHLLALYRNATQIV